MNIATLTWGTLNTFVSTAIANSTGLLTVAAKARAKTRQTTHEMNRLLSKNARLTALYDASFDRSLALARHNDAKTLELETLVRERAELRQKNVRQDSLIAKLRSENTEAKLGLASQKERNSELVQEVRKKTKAIRRRTQNVAAANLISMPGEAIPVWGIGVIVAATAFELKSACDTMKDMDALETELTGQTQNGKETEIVCGMEVPTSTELIAIVERSPQTAWNSATNGLKGFSDLVKSLPDARFPANWTEKFRNLVDGVLGWD